MTTRRDAGRPSVQGSAERSSHGIETRETRNFAAEVKFQLTPDLARRIQHWARVHLAPDPHGSGPAGDEYRVTSLYLDTKNLDVLYRRGSFGRAKFRVRRYGSNPGAFLERKMRTRRLLVKRRTLVALTDLPRLESPTAPSWCGHWFHRRLITRELRPVCQVWYERMARVGTTPHGDVRLTLDDHLHGHLASGLTFINDPGAPIPTGPILELKYRVMLPLVFKRLIEEFALRPERRSKFRLAMDALEAREHYGAMRSVPIADLRTSGITTDPSAC